MASLEGWGSAIELHPRSVMILNAEAFVAFTESGRQDSNLRSSAPKADALAATLRPGRPTLAERSRMSVGHTSLPTNPVAESGARRFGRPELAP
jgi:hypothetical protein